ncbi:MAG TPA: hypothetical protein VHK24_07790 [Steroidobacter sp.]|jgi:hypothetical protein|nr:hypothetical protein [Steroidobacter sp.]
MALKTKHAALRLRVEKETCVEFLEVCRALGKFAAQILREFMREYLARERIAQQRSFFGQARA